MIFGFYRQFSQGISVAICASMSAGVLSYMILDTHKIEKKQIKNEYEKQIKILNEELNKLKSKKEI
jgi:hypothetical protein